MILEWGKYSKISVNPQGMEKNPSSPPKIPLFLNELFLGKICPLGRAASPAPLATPLIFIKPSVQVVLKKHHQNHHFHIEMAVT